MKKILNLGLILTALLGYLEWGRGHHVFLYQAEWEILGKLFTHPLSVLHPFILIPLAGQLILLFSLFQQDPGKKAALAGLAALSLLMLLICFIGIMQLNWKMVASTVPFLVNTGFVIRYYWGK
ncbi:MAG: hypothetical protein ACXVAY_00385 [Mucilaginibacter sp.]